MTMNFCEQKLDWIWSNFGLDELVYLLLEHGAKIQNTALQQFGQHNTYT
jgi:hypothetical protein